MAVLKFWIQIFVTLKSMLFSTSHTARENEIKARIGVKGRKKKGMWRFKEETSTRFQQLPGGYWVRQRRLLPQSQDAFHLERKAARSQNGHWIPRIGALGPFPHSRLPSRMSLWGKWLRKSSGCVTWMGQGHTEHSDVAWPHTRAVGCLSKLTCACTVWPQQNHFLLMQR